MISAILDVSCKHCLLSIEMCVQGCFSPSRYTGVKEANISQNAAYYVFSQCADGSFEACPVDSLYRFTPVINYRTFTADEAEEKFSKRNKTINYSWLKVKERFVDTEATEKSASEETPVPKVKSKLDKLVFILLIYLFNYLVTYSFNYLVI